MAKGETGLPEKGEQLFFQIEELRGRGASQRESLRTIRATGRSIGDKTLRAVWRRLEEREAFARRLKFSRKDFRFKPEDVPKVPVLGGLVRDRYEYRFRVQGRRTLDGQQVSEFISITSDGVVPRGQLEERARRLITQASQGAAYSVTPETLKITIDSVSQRG